MTLRIVIEQEDSSEEYSCECPSCGAECEMDDKYCCQCGKKMPVQQSAQVSARMKAMNNMAGMEDD